MASRYQARQAGYVLPVDVRRITSHQPCESCGVRSVRYRASLDPPGREAVTFRLCENCIEAVRL